MRGRKIEESRVGSGEKGVSLRSLKSLKFYFRVGSTGVRGGMERGARASRAQNSHFHRKILNTRLYVPIYQPQLFLYFYRLSFQYMYVHMHMYSYLRNYLASYMSIHLFLSFFHF